MDIDLFWSIGGIFRFYLYPNIRMAIDMKLASSSSSSNRNPAKTLLVFLLFSLLFVLLAFANSSGELSKPSVSNMVTRKTLFSDDVAAQKVGFIPAGKKAKSNYGQFGESKHEVPSGPNPISNK
ncbi:hypothetical protein CASFOL_010261 [Castilleja foliolosa]|uniref:Uncharacterized protein n=1 Tax=Castilleja foliolosa TaxID=1961234 RepID=A0ABD3DS25_9LAMI